MRVPPAKIVQKNVAGNQAPRAPRANVNKKFEKQAFTVWGFKRFSYFYRVFVKSMIFSYQCEGFWGD
jgi:hypothetical protein